MNDVIKFIDEEIKKSQLKGLSSDDMQRLLFLKKIAMYLIGRTVSSKIEKVIQIEDENTGYSEYRILNDCESDDRDLWIEYMNGNVRINSGDLLIKMK